MHSHTEEQLRSLYTAMAEGLALHQVVYDAEGRAVDYILLDINPSYEKITGLPREQIVGQRASVVYGTGEPPYLDIYARVAYSGEATSFETYFPPMKKHFSISVFSPEPGRFATVFTDITERKEAEAERQRLLEESQRRTAELEATVSSIASGVVLYDSAGKITRMNKAAQEMLGYSSEESGLPLDRRVNLLQLRLGEDQHIGRPGETPTARALRGEAVHNQLLTLQRGSEAPRWVLTNAAPIQTPTGQMLGVISTFSDVTALHEVQQQLQEANVALEERAEELQQQAEELEVQEEELRCQTEELLQQNRDLERLTRDLEAERANLATILENAPEAILVADETGRVVRINPAAQALYNWSQQERGLPGFGPQRYRPDHTPLVLDEYPLTRSARYGETHQGVELSVRSADGQWRDLLVNAAPLRDGQGHITGAVTVQRDVTERKKIELENAQLYEQARHDAETRAALLREVNHRVKNNLVAITGMLYAEGDRPQVKDQPAFQLVIKDLVRRIEALSVVHGMLSAAQWAPLPLDELARHVSDNLLHTLPKGQLSIQVSPSTVCVSSDQAHPLALVLNELVMNAAKYALNGGGPRHMTVEVTAEDGKAALVLHDDGPGYPEEVLALRRSGVGLNLVQNLVRRNLRGQLILHNQGGAVAEIYFPLKETAGGGSIGKQ